MTLLRLTSVLLFSMDFKTEDDLAEAHFHSLLLQGCKMEDNPVEGISTRPIYRATPQRETLSPYGG